MERSSGGSERPIVSILGEKVAVGPLRHDLLPLTIRWFNDFEVASLNGLPLRPTTLEAMEEWYQRASEDTTQKTFTIYERATMRPIGGAELNHIDVANRTAYFSILIMDCLASEFQRHPVRLPVSQYGE